VEQAQAKPVQPGAPEPQISRATHRPSVTIVILPRFTEPSDLAGIEGLAPGTMSAGLATVTATQTYLDIGAGNRVFTSLYPGDEVNAAPEFDSRVPDWDHIADRAEEAPAEIVPGLLASTLQDEGILVRATQRISTAALIAANRAGQIERVPPGGDCVRNPCGGLTVTEAFPEQLPRAIAAMQGNDMLIAIERPPPSLRGVLALGVAGRGFGGNLTSDTTRTPGFALTTDVAPTILGRYGIPVPQEMSGHPIHSEGERDVAAVQERSDRMGVVASRRGRVVLRNIMIWTALAALAALFTRGRAARPAFALASLSVVYLPALLLVGAAVRPEELLTERLIVGIGAPVLAIATYLLLRGWAALAAACAVTVGAYTVDILAGSPLTAQSLLGPNPGLGVRFFGIGNELESVLAILIPVGVGAALAAAARTGEVSRRAAVTTFLAVGGVCALIFAAGRFGADVGAAIVFPAGAAVASLAVPGVAQRLRGRRLVLVALVAAPVLGLAALFAIDLVLGGDAHLSRSVLDAGGAGELADVVERRLRLAASSFGRGVQTTLFWFCVAAIAVAVWQRQRILGWLEASPLARAGFAGGAAATVLGVLANDSAATFFTLGTIGLLSCLAFAWSQREKVTGNTE
jgi:hypothetical protein